MIYPLVEKDLYNKILENMPITCVDILIYNQGRYLLVRRKDEPMAGSWWFPGGRLFKTEKTEDAAKRIALQEVGLCCSVRRFLGVYETIFQTGPNNIPVHSVNLCYFLVSSNSKVSLDEHHSEYQWVDQSRTPIDLNHDLKRFVEEVFVELGC